MSATRPFSLRAVLFDFDGTLTQPGALDFAALKREIGCPPESFVLEWIGALPTGAQRTAALEALERFELAGAAGSQPNHGAEELIRRLRAAGLGVGVLTRNGLPAVLRALDRFAHLRAADLDVIVTRDDAVAPKPAPDGVLYAARHLRVRPEELLVVGDYLLDMEAGRAAGAVTAYLTNGDSKRRRAAGGGEAGGTDGGETGGTDGGEAGAGQADGGGAGHAEAKAGRAEVGTSSGETRAANGQEPAEGQATAAEDVVPEPAVCDFVVHDLDGLDEILRLGLPLAPGKLPNDLLAGYLAGVTGRDPAVLVPAGVGEDVAALDVTGDTTLVVHGDPITLVSGDLGRWAVMVNANDIAASGGEPRWLLATVLLPVGSTPSQALSLLEDIADAAAASGMTVVGGHTEVTDAVVRPVVSVSSIGTVEREALRDKRGVLPGDQVVLTKALAVEGTALLAVEAGRRLRDGGMSDHELDACRGLLPSISVVPEARIAGRFAGVRAMHDVTEGGLTTAVRELSAAAGHGIDVWCDVVPVLPLTARVCELLAVDPLGLIASGSLLVCCRADETPGLLATLRDAGIAATVIGEVAAQGAGVRAFAAGRPAPWPEFACDEAARLLAEPRGE